MTFSLDVIPKDSLALIQYNKSVGPTSPWIQGNERFCADDVRGSGEE